MKAKILSIKYEPGEYIKTQGHKKHERVHYKRGYYVNPTGFGWATECRPSKITVSVDVNGTCIEIWVDHFFKNNWGRLTARRVEAIKATLPDEIEVIENKSHSGSIYYTADEAYLENWLKEAMKLCQ